MILAGAALLEHVGDARSHRPPPPSGALGAVAEGVRTADLKGHASTTEFTDAVIRRTIQKLEVWSSL